MTNPPTISCYWNRTKATIILPLCDHVTQIVANRMRIHLIKRLGSASSSAQCVFQTPELKFHFPLCSEQIVRMAAPELGLKRGHLCNGAAFRLIFINHGRIKCTDMKCDWRFSPMALAAMSIPSLLREALSKREA